MRYAVAGLATIPFVIASAWWVQHEGASFRRAAGEGRRERLLARALAVPEAPVVATTRPEPPPPIEPTPAPPPPPTRAPEPVAVVVPPPAPLPAKVEPPAPEPVVVAPPPVKKKEAGGLGPITSPLDGKDAALLSPQDERAIGAALSAAILLRHKAADSGTLRRRMIEVARPILANRKRKEIEYTFLVLDSEEVNAFSHPGGYVYVSAGMFRLVADDFELRFVLAHEIAHVDLKHDAKLVADAARLDDAAGRPGPGLLQRLYHQIAKGHTDEQEYEADAWAFARMLQADDSGYQARHFLRKYLDYVENNGGGNGRKPPKSGPDDGHQDVENHYPSHPPAMERFERMRSLRGGR